MIKERMMKCGSMMCSYQPMGDKVNFWRMVFPSRTSTVKDTEWVLDEIARLGEDIVIEWRSFLCVLMWLDFIIQLYFDMSDYADS